MKRLLGGTKCILVLGASVLGVWGAPSASAQGFAYEQPMTSGGGILRSSQLWIDPSGQNDLDSDAQAWEDFELPLGNRREGLIDVDTGAAFRALSEALVSLMGGDR